MSLRSPNLDDRSFAQLVADAVHIIDRQCPEWTDRTPSDPGMVLVDVFAHLTETMLYRLNRLPEKAYIEFLRLIGVQLYAPSSASVSLRFTLSRAQEKAVMIPRGTRVAAPGGGEAPTFITLEPAAIDAGALEAEVAAFHGVLVDGELLGHGTGLPGLSLKLRHTPVVAASDERLQLVIAVEEDPAILGSDTAALQHEGKAYRVWREVRNFSDPVEERHVFIVDRLTGIVSFAPAVRMTTAGGQLGEPGALAEIPPKDAAIRAWYVYGGGADGNVSAGVITQLKDGIPGVQVTNPRPATGGRDPESLQNAMQRGAQEVHSLHRAVTARDFELLAEKSSGAVERAKAFTRAAMWVHAVPGTAELVLVPAVPPQLRVEDRVTLDMLHQHESASALHSLQGLLDERRPLGTHVQLSWARYKQIVVRATVVVYREEDPDAVKERVLRRLARVLSPVSGADGEPGWAFGHALTNWHVYKILSAEPGVRTVSDLMLVAEHAPEDNVRALACDAFQPRTWYTAAGAAIYRSMNDGEGWERVTAFENEEVILMKAYPREAAAPSETGTGPARAGYLAAVTRVGGDQSAWRVVYSTDCGESWHGGPLTDFQVYDMAWIEQRGAPGLLLATDAGLYRVQLRAGAVPEQLVVEPNNLSLGFYAVAVSADAMGGVSVVVAARGKEGVYLSSQAGQSKTFKHIGLKNEEVRVLEVQHVGLRRYVWAGMAAVGDDPGKGCSRWLLTGTDENPEGWVAQAKGWQASSCRALSFVGNRVFAATRRGGVLALDADARSPEWKPANVSGGLPLRELKKFESVDALATDAQGRWVMAGGEKGVFRSTDQAATFQFCSGREYRDRVTLPETWLFCSGEHEIRVISEDELDGN